MSATRLLKRHPAAAAFAFVASMLLWRLVVLALDAPNLSFDEAQYWAWAQTLQLGYYSKPPMVAWAIAATTALFGDGEGAVKLGSALAHAGTAMVLFVLGRDLYGPRVGAWSAVTWMVVPAVSLSSMVITTDPFLLFFWALAMLCLVRAAESGPGVNRWWIGLGLAFGLGMLSKYAMALWAVSAALWIGWSPQRRGLAKAPGLWLATLLGLAVYAPNFLWNAANGFVSYAHTKDNANLGGDLFHFDKLLEFAGGQFGVFGPIAMAALVAGLVAAFRRPQDDRMRLLAAFALPVLALMTVESFLSRANANWTAPAFVSGTVLVAAFLSARAPRWLAASLALHLVLAGVMYNLDGLRVALSLDHSVKYDPMKRLRGWDTVGERVSAILAANPGARLMGDERKVMANLTYYVRPHPFDAVKWNPEGDIDDYFDLTTRLEPGQGAVIYVSELPALPEAVAASFTAIQSLGRIRVAIYPGYGRDLGVWRLDGFQGYRQ